MQNEKAKGPGREEQRRITNENIEKSDCYFALNCFLGGGWLRCIYD